MSQTTTFERAVNTYCKGLETVSAGCRGVECEHSNGEPEHQCEMYFSWVQCDSCGSTLGGDRSPAVGMWTDRGEFITIDMEICIDCVMFHANGDLPPERGEA
jgi:hypothetical protein